MTAVFVDTNVLVYLRDVEDFVKRSIANEWFETLWREQTGRTSMQVLNEYYVVTTRKRESSLDALRTPDEAWDDVQLLMSWKPQVTDAELLHVAREIQQRYPINWWDALVVGAAQLQQCGLLLTEDLQDGMMFGTVTVKNPFKMRVSEPRAAYGVAMAASPRHPRRGRPTRAIAPTE
jgi:predicted nucleic acid-binding protein